MAYTGKAGERWSDKYLYIAGLDFPIDTKGRKKQTAQQLRSIQLSTDIFLERVGNTQRIRDIKS